MRLPAPLFSRHALPAVPPCLILPCALNRDDHRFSRSPRAEPGVRSGLILADKAPGKRRERNALNALLTAGVNDEW